MFKHVTLKHASWFLRRVHRKSYTSATQICFFVYLRESSSVTNISHKTNNGLIGSYALVILNRFFVEKLQQFHLPYINIPLDVCVSFLVIDTNNSVYSGLIQRKENIVDAILSNKKVVTEIAIFVGLDNLN